MNDEFNRAVDADGNPIRFGDRCEIVSGHARFKGQPLKGRKGLVGTVEAAANGQMNVKVLLQTRSGRNTDEDVNVVASSIRIAL